jgi:hypothetical protein
MMEASESNGQRPTTNKVRNDFLPLSLEVVLDLFLILIARVRVRLLEPILVVIDNAAEAFHLWSFDVPDEPRWRIESLKARQSKVIVILLSCSIFAVSLLKLFPLNRVSYWIAPPIAKPFAFAYLLSCLTMASLIPFLAMSSLTYSVEARPPTIMSRLFYSFLGMVYLLCTVMVLLCLLLLSVAFWAGS